MELDKMIDASKMEALKKNIDGAKRFAVLVHRNPDGDAIGSSLALMQYLAAMGKEAKVIVPNDFPDFLKWMPAADEIIIYESQKQAAVDYLHSVDAVFCLDFNALSRISELGTVVAGLAVPRLLVDHHLQPEEGFDVQISEPAACSTAELIFHIIYELGGLQALSKNIAECIYVGIMTDTGNFAYASNRKDIYIIVAMLLEAGVDKDITYRKVFYNATLNKMKLTGFVMYEKLRVFSACNAALMTLTYKDLRRFNAAKGDTEGLVNVPLQIKGIRFSCLLREEVPGKVNVSLRSVDDFPCNEVAAEFFCGGGHKNASGGEVYGTLDYAIERFKAAIAKYKSKLTE